MSNLGRVRGKHRIIAGTVNFHGYIDHQLMIDGVRKSVREHTLVLLAFVGPRLEGMQACHADGSRTNNRLPNLRWDTVSGNHADKLIHGTDDCGHKNTMAKFTADEVAEVRRRYVSGEASSYKLADEYGVCGATICNLISGRTYNNVPGAIPVPEGYQQRRFSKKSEDNGNAKLTMELAKTMREFYSSGISVKMLANVFGVGKTTVRRVISHETFNDEQDRQQG